MCVCVCVCVCVQCAVHACMRACMNSHIVGSLKWWVLVGVVTVTHTDAWHFESYWSTTIWHLMTHALAKRSTPSAHEPSSSIINPRRRAREIELERGRKRERDGGMGMIVMLWLLGCPIKMCSSPTGSFAIRLKKQVNSGREVHYSAAAVGCMGEWGRSGGGHQRGSRWVQNIKPESPVVEWAAFTKSSRERRKNCHFFLTKKMHTKE